FNNLVAGNYQVVVKDTMNCNATANAVVTEPAQLIVSAIGFDIPCYGSNSGSISAAALGGTPPYLFNIGGSPQSSGVFNNLPAGNYLVTVTDAHACTGTTFATVAQPTLLTVTTSTIDATCGLADGSIIINANGGVTPYLYTIDSGI